MVCFRYTRVDLNEPALDRLNKQVEVELQERGTAVLSIVNIRGKKHLHAAITNHRSRRDDLYVLVREVIQIGNELAPSAVPGSQSL